MRQILVALCLVSAASLAQSPAPTPKPAAQELIFDSSDTVKGTIVRPLGNIYSVPPKAKFGCLIERRMNFNDKLQESVHEM